MSNWFTRLFTKSTTSKYGTDGLTDSERTRQERQRMANERRIPERPRGYTAARERAVQNYRDQGYDSTTALAMYYSSITATQSVNTADVAAEASKGWSDNHSTPKSDPTPDTSSHTNYHDTNYGSTDYSSGSSSSSDSSSSYDSGSSSSSGSFD